MRGLSFIAYGESFVVDVTLVQKVVRNIAVTPVPTAPPAVVGISNIKGRVITVLSIAALFGRPRESAITANAVIFKASTSGNDQMGLLIDKPGDLIDINDERILPPPVTATADETSHISGVAEVGETLYRIIDVDSITNKFINSSNNPLVEGI